MILSYYNRRIVFVLTADLFPRPHNHPLLLLLLYDPNIFVYNRLRRRRDRAIENEIDAIDLDFDRDDFDVDYCDLDRDGMEIEIDLDLFDCCDDLDRANANAIVCVCVRDPIRLPVRRALLRRRVLQRRSRIANGFLLGGLTRGWWRVLVRFCWPVSAFVHRFRARNRLLSSKKDRFAHNHV